MKNNDWKEIAEASEKCREIEREEAAREITRWREAYTRLHESITPLLKINEEQAAEIAGLRGLVKKITTPTPPTPEELREAIAPRIETMKKAFDFTATPATDKGNELPELVRGIDKKHWLVIKAAFEKYGEDIVVYPAENLTAEEQRDKNLVYFRPAYTKTGTKRGVFVKGAKK